MDAALIHVASPGARLAVRVYPGTGAPLLLLHGGPGCPDYLGTVARLLSPALQTVTFDQRGVGMSETFDSRYSLESYLSDIEAIRIQLGLERWHIFGHSWGGLLAQIYAWTHSERVRSLFLCDSALGVGDDWRRMRRAVVGHTLRTTGGRNVAATVMWYIGTWLPGPAGNASARRFFQHIWRIGYPDPSHADPPDPAWLKGVNRHALHETHRAALTATDTLPRDWSDAPFPVLVLYGSKDIFGGASRVVRQRFPTARQIDIDDAAHFPWLQAPRVFRRALADFYHLSERALPHK